MKFSLIPAFVLSLSLTTIAFAGSATWNLNPTSGDWNTPENWTPATVPNGPTDTATFGVSNVTGILYASGTAPGGGIIFSPGASAFTITVGPFGFGSAGPGITNNSGTVQNFVVNESSQFSFNQDGAVAGDATIVFTNNGATDSSATGGLTLFVYTANAGSATFINNPASGTGLYGGYTYFIDDSSAGQGSFVANGAAVPWINGGNVLFNGNSTAAQGTFTAYPGAADKCIGGYFTFDEESRAGEAIFNLHGGSVPGSLPGLLRFLGSSTADDSTVVADGDSRVEGGGKILFLESSLGDNVRIQLIDQGILDISGHEAPGVTIGSLEGRGKVFLGSNTLSVGNNGLSTNFEGRIRDRGFSNETGGSLTKVGPGTLSLNQFNSYTGSTSVEDGTLLINNTRGSGTGSGPVTVSGGTLGGRGIISGRVTLGTGSGTGSVLAPSEGGSNPTALTIQNALTFKADGRYTYKLNTNKATADQVIANGVAIESGGARFNFTTVANKKLTAGKVFTAISNTAATAFKGAFSNLVDGSTVTVGVNKLQVSYSGGDGNDLTLTVVP